MKKNFIPYKEAVSLKEIAFNEFCIAYYLIPEIERTGEIILHYNSRGKEILKENDWTWVYKNFPKFRRYLKGEHCYKYSTNNSKFIVSAPLWQQAFDWFRIKGYYHTIIPHERDDVYYFEIYTNDKIHSYKYSEKDRGGYETCRIKSLQKLIGMYKEDLKLQEQQN